MEFKLFIYLFQISAKVFDVWDTKRVKEMVWRIFENLRYATSSWKVGNGSKLGEASNGVTEDWFLIYFEVH